MAEPLLAIEGLTKTFHVAKSASGNTQLRALDAGQCERLVRERLAKPEPPG